MGSSKKKFRIVLTHLIFPSSYVTRVEMAADLTYSSQSFFGTQNLIKKCMLFNLWSNSPCCASFFLEPTFRTTMQYPSSRHLPKLQSSPKCLLKKKEEVQHGLLTQKSKHNAIGRENV